MPADEGLAVVRGGGAGEEGLGAFLRTGGGGRLSVRRPDVSTL